eukprot:300186-Hanusia_phi.AAC.3
MSSTGNINLGLSHERVKTFEKLIKLLQLLRKSIGQRQEGNGALIPLQSPPTSPTAVSYTHLTLPTICSV